MIKIHLIPLDLSVIVSRSFIKYLTDQLHTSYCDCESLLIFCGDGMFIANSQENCLLIFAMTLAFAFKLSCESSFHWNVLFPNFVKSIQWILIKHV